MYLLQPKPRRLPPWVEPWAVRGLCHTQSCVQAQTDMILGLIILSNFSVPPEELRCESLDWGVASGRLGVQLVPQPHQSQSWVFAGDVLGCARSGPSCHTNLEGSFTCSSSPSSALYWYVHSGTQLLNALNVELIELNLIPLYET